MSEAGSRRSAAVHLAARQLGVVARWQLLAIGWSSAMVSWALRRGVLHRVFNGAYLLGHPVPPPGASELAAILVTRADALSHATAARWYGWPVQPPPGFELTSARAHCAARDGVILHRTGGLAPSDVRTHHGLPVTSPLRTLFDLAAHEHSDLEAAASAAHAGGLVTPSLLTREIAAHPGRAGIKRLGEIAGAESGGFTRSDAERRMRTLCRRAHLPQARANVKVGPWELDFLWPEQRLVVELDGYGFHGHRGQFERDRRKQADLVAAGYRVLRFTVRQLEHDELWVLATIARSLGSAQ